MKKLFLTAALISTISMLGNLQALLLSEISVKAVEKDGRQLYEFSAQNLTSGFATLEELQNVQKEIAAMIPCARQLALPSQKILIDEAEALRTPEQLTLAFNKISQAITNGYSDDIGLYSVRSDESSITCPCCSAANCFDSVSKRVSFFHALLTGLSQKETHTQSYTLEERKEIKDALSQLHTYISMPCLRTALDTILLNDLLTISDLQLCNMLTVLAELIWLDLEFKTNLPLEEIQKIQKLKPEAETIFNNYFSKIKEEKIIIENCCATKEATRFQEEKNIAYIFHGLIKSKEIKQGLLASLAAIEDNLKAENILA